MNSTHFLLLLLLFALLVTMAGVFQARAFRRRVWEPLRDTFGFLPESEWSDAEWHIVSRTRAAGTFPVWDNRLRWRYDAAAQRLVLRPALRCGPCIAIPRSDFAVQPSGLPGGVDVIIATAGGELILTVSSRAAAVFPAAD